MLFNLGHAVPAGSHVRLNLQTGHREVKMGEEEGLKHWSDGNGYSNRRKTYSTINTVSYSYIFPLCGAGKALHSQLRS